MRLTHFILAALLLPACLAPEKSKDPKVIELPNRFPRPEVEPPPVAPPPRPGFVTPEAFEDRLVIDSNALSTQNALDAFYINGCDRYNNGEEIVELKSAIDKALNMLSTATRPAKSVGIGPGCIFRISQDDFNLNDDKLDLIAGRGMFTIVPDTTRAQIIRANLNRRVTWMYLDDFIVTAFENDILVQNDGNTYRAIVRQPKFEDDFWSQELGGESLQDQYDQERALAGCTVTDKIAYGKGRCFSHVEGVNGLINVAYDSSSANPVSVSQTPFLLEVALADSNRGEIYGRLAATNRIYVPAGAEMFYPLPNGFPGVRAQNGVGVGVGFAPLTLVQHAALGLLNIDQQIYHGSCVGCHIDGSQGYEEAAWQIINARGSSFNEEEKLRSDVFMGDTPIRQHLREYDEQYQQAMTYIGQFPGQRDPMNARGIEPLRDGLRPLEMASKLGLTVEQYQDCLESSEVSASDLAGHIQGANLTLSVVAERDPATGANAFDTVIRECNLWRDREI